MLKGDVGNDVAYGEDVDDGHNVVDDLGVVFVGKSFPWLAPHHLLPVFVLCPRREEGKGNLVTGSNNSIGQPK